MIIKDIKNKKMISKLLISKIILFLCMKINKVIQEINVKMIQIVNMINVALNGDIVDMVYIIN